MFTLLRVGFTLTASFSASRRLQQLHPILKKSAQSFSSVQTSSSVFIKVTPGSSLFDEKVHIKVPGLPSKAKVTLHACTEQEWQKKPAKFVSCSHYVSSGTGEVDVWKDASVGGTYTGVEPMGLFWSLLPDPAGPRNIRLVIRNVEQPLQYELSVFLGHIQLEDLHVDPKADRYQPLAITTVSRTVKAHNVRRIPVREGGVRGTLFLPPGEGPFPGIIDMFGLAGGLMEGRAALFASRGFAALALPFFKYEDLPESFNEVTFNYFEEAAKWFASHKSVKPGGIGVLGISGGAAVSLMMAWKCPEIKACVRMNSPGFHGCTEHSMGDLFGKCITVDLLKNPDDSEGVVFRDSWTLHDEYIVPLWEKDTPVLTLICNDDGQVSPTIASVVSDYYPENKKHLLEVVHYEGAGHLLEPPYTPLCRFCYNPFFGQDLFWGGRPKEHAVAQEDSWQRIQAFFHKHIG